MADTKEHLKSWTNAMYRIEVEGYLEKSWADRLAGMQITHRKRADKSIVTCLVGGVLDQSELTGVLNGLAELHLPIINVERINENNGDN